MRDVRILRLMKEPKFGSDLERRYCMMAVEISERETALLWYRLGAIYWLSTVVLAFVLGFDDATLRVILPGAGGMALLSYLGQRYLKATRTIRVAQFVGFVLSNVLMLAAAHVDAYDGVLERGILGLWILGSSVGLGLLAFRQYVHHVAIAIYMATIVVALQPYPDMLLGVLFALALATVSSNAQVFLHRAFKLESIHSFRQQCIFTPKQVVLKAIESKTSIDEVFGPQERQCVCLCSDWRSFQSFSATVSAARLAAVLEAYYAIQVELLDAAFAEGNYFIDWIADELFVVAFETPTSSPATVAACMVSYAKQCLTARSRFAAEHGAPLGVDVGISAGIATVGMLGPLGNRKATALGNVAGLARRLQSVAKELRTLEGPLDRIVVAPDLDLPDAAAAGLEHYPLPASLKVKDLTLSFVRVGSANSLATREASELRVAA